MDSPNLTGKAQQAFAALEAEEAAKYKELKHALLTTISVRKRIGDALDWIAAKEKATLN